MGLSFGVGLGSHLGVRFSPGLWPEPGLHLVPTPCPFAGIVPRAQNTLLYVFSKLEVMRAETQLGGVDMEVVFLASPPYRDFEKCGWWDPKAWSCLLRGKVSQVSPCRGSK